MLSVTAAGNVGQDAELKTIEGGNHVLNFTVATSEYVKGEELTTWAKVSLWGKRAEKVASFIIKGKSVVVTGTGYIRKYTDKNGKEVSSLEINASNVKLMGGKGESSTGAPKGGYNNATTKEDFAF